VPPLIRGTWARPGIKCRAKGEGGQGQAEAGEDCGRPAATASHPNATKHPRQKRSGWLRTSACHRGCLQVWKTAHWHTAGLYVYHDRVRICLKSMHRQISSPDATLVDEGRVLASLLLAGKRWRQSRLVLKTRTPNLRAGWPT
jgi:hypothetical protein